MARSRSSLPLHIISFNIRYAADPPSENEKPWAERAPLVVNLLNDEAAKANSSGAELIIGLQEVLHSQLLDILSGLGPEWAHFGVGRDDGKEEGEFNPIIYRPRAFKLLRGETKWLSPTPDEPSFGWNAGCRRIVEVIVLEHIGDGTRFIAANTHLDNASLEARAKGIMVAINAIRAVRDEWGPLGVCLTGDFNSKPGEDAYMTVVKNGFLADLYEIAGESKRRGYENTYTGFIPGEEETEGKRIDFIWLGPKVKDIEKWSVERYEVLGNVVEDVWMSDHRAVLGVVKLVVKGS